MSTSAPGVFCVAIDARGHALRAVASNHPMDGLKSNDPKTNAFFDAEILNEFDHLCESWSKTGISIAIGFVEA